MTELSEASPRREIVLVPSNVWCIGLVVLADIALGLILHIYIQGAGSVVFTALMPWFATLRGAAPGLRQ